MGASESPGKPFDISKRDVWEAWLKVKENQGAPGVDGQSIADFEKDLKNNCYKVWNRMSSGSYFPPPVRAVDIAKPHGVGVRTLGIPTVADRIAQTVVAKHLEERVERIFHPDSYGYRPGRSALDAVETARRRCWQYDWVIDLRHPVVLRHRAVAARPGRGREPHRRRLGAAVRQAVAGRPAAAPGRDDDRAGPGNPAGVSGLAGAGEPVRPLRAGSVADPRAPRCGVRAVRRRCAGALRDPRPGPGGPGRDRAAATRSGHGRSPGQDQDRVLPGRQAPRPVPGRVVHLPGVHVLPAPEPEPPGRAVPGLPARDQPAGPEEDQPDRPPLAAAPADLLYLRRAGPRDQPDRGGVDGLLRAVLPLQAVSGPGAHQRLPGALDPQQVPTAGQDSGRTPETRRAGRQPAPAVPALGLGHQRLAVRMTRAR